MVEIAPTATTPVRSPGCHSASRPSRTHAHPVVAPTAAASTARASQRRRWVQNSATPVATRPPIPGARATV